jgi:hypothetical protein
MKKLNLNFFGLKAKIVLPLFLVFGLFMISAGSISAQYVPFDKATHLVKTHIERLTTNQALAQAANQAPIAVNQQLNSPELNQAITQRAEYKYGVILLSSLEKEGNVVAAFGEADKKFQEFPYPNVTAAVKQIYTELLSL